MSKVVNLRNSSNIELDKLFAEFSRIYSLTFAAEQLLLNQYNSSLIDKTQLIEHVLDLLNIANQNGGEFKKHFDGI